MPTTKKPAMTNHHKTLANGKTPVLYLHKSDANVLVVGATRITKAGQTLLEQPRFYGLPFSAIGSITPSFYYVPTRIRKSSPRFRRFSDPVTRYKFWAIDELKEIELTK